MPVVVIASMDGVGVVGLVALAIVALVVAAIALVRGRFDGRLRAATAPSMADVGIPVPSGRVAVVQFSGEFCAVCPQARTLVERALLDHPAIAHVEVDVAEHLDAVRTFDIRRTPTMIIVDSSGAPVHRVSGMPREAELRQAVGDLAGRR